MFLNFDFLFLILFSFLSLVFFFIHTSFFFLVFSPPHTNTYPQYLFFFFLFFLLVFSPPHMNTYPQYLSSLFVWLFVFLVISKTFPPSPSLFRSLSLTHTHTNFSPSISHKQILFHACINHWKRTKIRVLPTSKDMQLNHHIDQISVLHVFFFWF